MYRHRGPVTTLRERTFRFRVQREFEALHHLQQWGIPCSEPIAWAHGHSAEHGRFEILATWEVAGAQSLRALAAATRAENIRWDLSSLYRNLRRMHESGMFHGVLHLRNVLAGRDAAGDRAFYIIDTPGALLYPRSIVGTSMALFDLLLLSSQAARHLELPEARIPLEAYGMDEPSLRALRRAITRLSADPLRPPAHQGRSRRAPGARASRRAPDDPAPTVRSIRSHSESSPVLQPADSRRCPRQSARAWCRPGPGHRCSPRSRGWCARCRSGPPGPDSPPRTAGQPPRRERRQILARHPEEGVGVGANEAPGHGQLVLRRDQALLLAKQRWPRWCAPCPAPGRRPPPASACSAGSRDHREE